MAADATRLIPLLKQVGIEFDEGLSDEEVDRTEVAFGFRFPPDLRAFLQAALPRGERFPNWRVGPAEELLQQLRWPLHGIEFDVEHSEFWLPEWGERPELLKNALDVVRKQFESLPKLIPIYGHRYIPAEPETIGSPVLSVYQTDIIWYGLNLEDYLRHEFKLSPRRKWPDQVKAIRFWDPLRFQAFH